jgi:hypothetical protein
VKVLQLVGHFQKWNLDSHFQNSIGRGFVFCAYSFPHGYFVPEKLNGYSRNEIIDISFFDLQYFAKKEAANISKGKLGTYDFHPAANPTNGEETNTWLVELIKKGIKYQIETLGLKHIIIPNYYENDDVEELIGIIKTINKWLSKNRIEGLKYYMSVPLTNHTIIDETKIDNILYCLTDIDIIFDGYYIVCESKPENRQKVSIDYKYLHNLAILFSILKKQDFITIYSYANWDSLVFLALTDIDYITIGTYENLRNFNIRRFTTEENGGPSKGWYFSEKLMNFVKAPLLDLLRIKKGIDLIKNEKNIFSDIILEEGYPWSNQKPEVHKNYLLSIERMLNEIGDITDMIKRKEFLLGKIDLAIDLYDALEKKGIYLTDESKNYHLETWKSFLRSKK